MASIFLYANNKDITDKTTTLEYSGEAVSFQVDTTDPEGLVVSVSSVDISVRDSEGTVVSECRTPGTYTVTATVNEEGYDETVVSGTVTIAKKSLSLALIDGPKNVEYNGTSTFYVPGWYTVSGYVKGDDHSNTRVVARATFNDSAVGTYSNVGVAFDVYPDYYAVPENQTVEEASITPKQLTVVGTSASQSVYGTIETHPGTAANIIGDDDVGVSIASYEVNEDTGYVTVHYELSGEDAGNYTVSDEEIEPESEKPRIDWRGIRITGSLRSVDN